MSIPLSLHILRNEFDEVPNIPRQLMQRFTNFISLQSVARSDRRDDINNNSNNNNYYLYFYRITWSAKKLLSIKVLSIKAKS